MGWQILCLIAIIFSWVVSAAAQSQCKLKCGDLHVPYPFGLGDSSKCSLDSSFSLFCNETINPPVLVYGNIPVLNISIENATALVQIETALNCYDEGGSYTNYYQSLYLINTPFTFSTLNRFTAIGCDTLGVLAYRPGLLGTGCFSTCDQNTVIPGPKNITQGGNPCPGIGCCETTVPRGLKNINISLSSVDDHKNILASNPCDYSFLAASSENSLHVDFLRGGVSSVVVLDWAIGNTSCETARSGGRDDYICGSNTNCINQDNGPGYKCSCVAGYKGNPYTETGCTDIITMICKVLNYILCLLKENTEKDNSTNSFLSWELISFFPYIDECLPEYKNVYPCKGDGKVSCKLRTVVKVLLGMPINIHNFIIGALKSILIILLLHQFDVHVFFLGPVIGVVVFLIAFVLPLLWFYQRKMKEANQRRNGGLLLKHLSVKIFRVGQLHSATDNYRKVLGEGGNGCVYKGSVDNIEIAVKKSKRVDQDQIEQFLNEVDIVSKINHKNVVKLLGVCLETKVPMLVYEYVSNGTLSDHLHGKSQKSLHPWSRWLRIIAETAKALEYMHSLADPPIVHRDIKTANILLDGKYTAKVADFGASKLIPLDQAMGQTRGQGTMGYLDPEYLQTAELTVRSDVYSFGVVVMELLCKRKPLSRGESGEMISIVKVFTSMVAHNQLDEILNIGDLTEHEIGHVHTVAELAVRCVAMPSTDRPTMTEVTNVLNELSKQYPNLDAEQHTDDLGDLQYPEQDVVTTSVHFELESPFIV
ncbi:hypothetical protein AQUCO_01200079v1 [Aquilegia coerulea]|uniref:Protein kinase domain-containing protein n=1 Tax=Aquilegia coerulea TaxID=218851 RepID=A0A2G5E4H1_AQUCA|nr:hypothetical protein AQUCO_01200079v1 [Aquilegia coerulea]